MVGWLRTPAGIPIISGFVQTIGGGGCVAPYGGLHGSRACSALVAGQRRDPFFSRKQRICGSVTGGSPRLLARGSEGEGMIRSATWSPAGDSVDSPERLPTVRPIEGGRQGSLAPPPAAFPARGRQMEPSLRASRGISLRLRPGLFFGNEAPSAVLLFFRARHRAIDLTGKNSSTRVRRGRRTEGFYGFFRTAMESRGRIRRSSGGGWNCFDADSNGFESRMIALASERIAYSNPLRKGISGRFRSSLIESRT